MDAPGFFRSQDLILINRKAECSRDGLGRWLFKGKKMEGHHGPFHKDSKPSWSAKAREGVWEAWGRFK